MEPLNDVLDQRTFGTLIHKILEKFCSKYDAALDDQAYDFLKRTAEEELKQYSLDESQKIFWKNRVLNIVDWIFKIESEQRNNIQKIWCETEGEITFEGKEGPVTFTAKADRLEETKDGFYNIVDYKTGNCPSQSDVQLGYAPQLLLEALIAQNGVFKKNGQNLKAKDVQKLIYWRLLKDVAYRGANKNKDMATLLEQTKDILQQMINLFDDENTPYLFNPNPNHLNAYSDYEHLARFKEWSD